MQGRMIGCLIVFCRELSSHIGLAVIGCSFLDGHAIRIYTFS